MLCCVPPFHGYMTLLPKETCIRSACELHRLHFFLTTIFFFNCLGDTKCQYVRPHLNRAYRSSFPSTPPLWVCASSCVARPTYFREGMFLVASAVVFLGHRAQRSMAAEPSPTAPAAAAGPFSGTHYATSATARARPLFVAPPGLSRGMETNTSDRRYIGDASDATTASARRRYTGTTVDQRT